MNEPCDSQSDTSASKSKANLTWQDALRALVVALLLGGGIGIAYFHFLRSWTGLLGAVLGSTCGVIFGVTTVTLIPKRGLFGSAIVFGVSAFVGGFVFGLVIGQNPFLTGAIIAAVIPGVYVVERIVFKFT